jgi:hypothetical protein
MSGSRAFSSLVLLPVLLLGVACGKDGGGGSTPTAADPTIPVIANLQVTLTQPCTVAGVAGTVKTVAVDYTDADGDLRGGVVELRVTGAVGGPSTPTGAIPSRGVAITGTTAGTVTVTTCLHFGSNTSLIQEVRVTDASGKASNVLTTTITNPGLPLLPRDTDAAPRESLEFVR